MDERYNRSKMKITEIEARIAAMSDEEKQSLYGQQSQSQLDSYRHYVQSVDDQNNNQ